MFIGRSFHWLLVFVILALSCHKKVEEPVDSPDHLKYFGFTLVDTFWDDPTDDSTKTTYIDEVHPFSNIADVLVVSPDDFIVDRLQAMKNLGVKGFIHLNELFFIKIGNAGMSGAQYDLRADFKTRWDQFITLNSLALNTDLISALYIGEEPTWNDISFLEMKAATDYVKSTVADIPIMLIEAYPALSQLQVPESVDWIGFDHYFIKNPAENADYLAELQMLKNAMSHPDQKLVMVMDAHFIAAFHTGFGNIELDEMKSVATSYYKLAQSVSDVIALIGYFWPSGFDDPDAIGARHMPTEIRNEYIRIGKEITGK